MTWETPTPGEDFVPAEDRFRATRVHCMDLLRVFNHEPDAETRAATLRELLGHVGERTKINPPFSCDYGVNVFLGDRVFVNVHCVFLDGAPIRIGSDTQIGPGVQLLTPDHPRDPERRRTGVEQVLPVTVGENVWIGGGAIVCPGVTVGDDAIVGAGAVVVRDVPPRVVVAGNPARVVRRL